ncbi:hypothetical protein [Candidatus Harpocratesius sp.]
MGYMDSFPEKFDYKKEIDKCQKILKKSPINTSSIYLKQDPYARMENYNNLRQTYIKKIMQREIIFSIKKSHKS